MRRRPARFALALAAATLALAAPGIIPAAAQVARLERQTATDSFVMVRPHQYDYVPDIIRDGDTYHLYWCGSVPHQPGDFVLHAEATQLEGPYHASDNARANSYDIALRPTGVPGSFDGEHVCDPTVIKSGANFFMYFDGAAIGAKGTGTAIGIAGSVDGVHFGRGERDEPIVRPAETAARPATRYGAGQPAVFAKDGLFYLSFTDTTGAGANPAIGAGQFLLRSPDPAFRTGTEELTAGGWVARPPGRHTAEFAWLQAFGIDTAYDPLSRKLFAASDQDGAATWVYVVDPASFRPLGHFALPGSWRDGPSLAKGADHTLPPRPSCDTLDVSVFKGDSRDAAHHDDVTSWDIALARGTVHLGERVCRR